MDEFLFVIQNAERVGVVAGLGIFIFAVHKRWLVPGWVYEQCNNRSNALDQLLTAGAARVEAKLERLEEAERQRYSREHP